MIAVAYDAGGTAQRLIRGPEPFVRLQLHAPLPEGWSWRDASAHPLLMAVAAAPPAADLPILS